MQAAIWCAAPERAIRFPQQRRDRYQQADVRGAKEPPSRFDSVRR